MNQASGKHLTIGLLAHVDAGKTTLAEAILYQSGAIRKMGRVDNRDAFLDTFYLERERGITIFSKQAEVELPEIHLTMLDTPGHVDFSAEMERTLAVLDAAVLVVSGPDGVQGHTKTLWKLLARYQIPVFLFINKMDQAGCDQRKLMQELQEKLDKRIVAFDEKDGRDAWLESVAMCNDAMTEEFLNTGTVGEEAIRQAVSSRELFPCLFGSALHLSGITELIRLLTDYTSVPVYPEDFGAQVFKIAHDERDTRLTYLKVTGGTLKMKDGIGDDAEKVNQIRIYSGEKFQTVSEAPAGTVCAVTGPVKTFAGEALGSAGNQLPSLLAPVLSYDLILPAGCDTLPFLQKMEELSEEQPELAIAWNDRTEQIEAKLMGPVQVEILKTLIKDRFGVDVTFGEGSIVYQETIAGPVEGVGHFEPLRHYAEVHLLMEPGEPGSGLAFASSCSEEMLPRGTQNMILTLLKEQTPAGVLTGSPITDMKITLVTGRFSVKHTEGGDFKEAARRAVRCGLMQAENVLLEPWYDFQLEVPQSAVGRAMSDLQRMEADFSQPELMGEQAVITGTCPVFTMQNYQAELAAYSHGAGQLSVTFRGYAPCHNAEEVIGEKQYDPDLDPDNPSYSIFCSHGSGFAVAWQDVPDYMHVDSGLGLLRKKQEEEEDVEALEASYREQMASDEELTGIFERTYGPIKRRIGDWDAAMRMDYSKEEPEKEFHWKKNPDHPRYLLVDGYNVIFASPELSALAEKNVNAARERLMDMLCNYQGYRNYELILVYDAYRVEGHVCEMFTYHNISVIYTKEAETADKFIERTAHKMGRKYDVTVATSDGVEQIIIQGQGCKLISSRELLKEMEEITKEMRKDYMDTPGHDKTHLLDDVSEDVAEKLEKIRRGE